MGPEMPSEGSGGERGVVGRKKKTTKWFKQKNPTEGWTGDNSDTEMDREGPVLLGRAPG